ncbi:hypothetical protein COOONC_20109 [Cooperia oncophora]
MTLLGENLKELKLSCPKEYMTAKTWTRNSYTVPVQVRRQSVKVVHDYGFVHRDIKPNNFVMGYRDDYERARIVHILDFGLSRKMENGSQDEHEVRPNSAERYDIAHRTCTKKKEQGRRDDLWSLYYVFIELHCGLPWQTLRDKQKVELLKLNMNDKDLVLNFPVELHGIIPYLRTLNYYQRPDYSMFYNGLVAVMKRVGAKASDPYDWERPEYVKNIQKRLKGPYAWENAAEFFKSDPIKVNSAPPPKKKKRKETVKQFPPLEEEGRRDSSEHTAGSTDIEKRIELPTELTMTEMDKKLFERFGIQKKEDEKLRELGCSGTETEDCPAVKEKIAPTPKDKTEEAKEKPKSDLKEVGQIKDDKKEEMTAPTPKENDLKGTEEPKGPKEPKDPQDKKQTEGGKSSDSQPPSAVAGPGSGPSSGQQPPQ